MKLLQNRRDRLKEKELLFTREGTVIQLDMYTAIFKTGNQQRPTVTLSNVTWQLDRRELGENGSKCKNG